MKCVKSLSTGVVKRVKDVVAKEVVGTEWIFCPKSEWKKNNPIPRKATK